MVVDGFANAFLGDVDFGFFDVFQPGWITFRSILGSFWEAVAPCSHLPGPFCARVTEIDKFCEKVTLNGEPFWVPFGGLGHHWPPWRSPPEQK